MTQRRIPVWVKALDPLSQFGLVHALRRRPEVALINDAELADSHRRITDQHSNPPAVALIAVDSLDAGAVQLLRSAAPRGCRRTVLISGTIDDEALTTAVELGVSG